MAGWGKHLSAAESKQLEDHLFWCAVDAATRAGLPIKLHTGYYAGQNYMPLSRLINNPGSYPGRSINGPRSLV